MTLTTPDNAESHDLQGDGEPPGPFHLESYAHLLQRGPVPVGSGGESGDPAHHTPNSSAAIDAIIVPTIRSAEQLHPAVRLAKQLRCQLIALYTDEFPDGLWDALAEARPGQATALALRSGAGHRLLDIGSAIPQSRVSASTVDISRKCNLGLMIGRSCMWTRMLFLHDDIRKLSADKVSSAAALLSEYPVVGLQVTAFPDASVVGHARRLAGSGRKPFISGGSMLVNPQRMRGFFPPVYHEDWLCILDHLRLGEVAIAGTVAQLRYQPFDTTARAQLQEFGDILASGLLWLVHAQRDWSTDERGYWREATNQQFWRDVLRQRATLLDDLHERLDLVYHHRDQILALESIRAARKRCGELSPDEFVSFIAKWLDRLAIWRERISPLPRADSVAKALAALGLLRTVGLFDDRGGKTRATLTSRIGRARRIGAKARGVFRDDLDETTPSPRLQLSTGPRGADGPGRDPAEDNRVGSPAESADRAENEARRALAQRSFGEAIEFLREAIALDPGRTGRLQPDLDCLSGRPGDSADRRAWRRGLWLALAAGSPLELHNAKPVTVAPPIMPEPAIVTPTISELTSDPPVPVRPEEGGAALEVAFIRLLERFFSLAADDKQIILDRLRRQSSGTQYGHDVQFDCTVAPDNVVRCHVECKNYSRQLQLADVADKILQTQAYWNAKNIDYFVIVTPRAGISNDLDHFIQIWNAGDNSPFRIQVWGPEQKIKEFFALEPSAYQAVYGTGSCPSPDPAAVVARWAGRLAPVLRLPASLSGYLDAPSMHCLPGEDSAHFGGLMDDCVEVDAVDLAGSPLGQLSDVLARWLDDPALQPFLLLGEFGDGKSFACYRLTRLLARRYRQNPAAVPFPIRLALRDLVAAGNPHELLSRRLQALGSDIQDWAHLQILGRTLVVLDGFDEMSAQIDHATVVRNLRLLADCVRYFSASKLLVTSRTHYFETSRMQRRFFEQLGAPGVARLAPLPLNERIEHLQAYAEQHDLSGKFERIRRLYDPIGLAGKPLFLQMIKETLPTLPDEDFDELVLYDASVRDSLERKAEMLEDKGMLTLRKEAIEGMVELLEALAVKLLQTGGQPVDLRTFGADRLDIARVLWKMSEADAGTEQAQDARARLGVRSLLKPSPQAGQPEAWSVTFCHRSMAEYFVARALARALHHDHLAAQDLLSFVILGPEIIDFTALSVNKDGRVADLTRTLAALARSATLGASHGYLGGNAITLTYRGRRRPASHQWAGLDLSYADLSGADLSGADFAGSSLRFATLDNADLSGADLTGCDLTGVRLEETAPVICVAPGRTQGSVLACYGDGTIREWLPRGSRLVPQKLLDGLAGLKFAAWGPYGDLVVVDGRGLSIWEIAADSAARQDAFPIRAGTDHIRLAAGTVSFARTDGHQHLAALVNCDAAEVDAVVTLTHDGPVAFAGNQAATIPMSANAVGLARLHQPDRAPVRLPVADVTAVDMHGGEGDAARLLLADGLGQVTSLRIAPDGEARELSASATQRLHDGPVLSAAFLSADLVATGGLDRSLTICEWDRDHLRILHQLKLILRCAGARTAGVRGEHERHLLEALRARAEADADAAGGSHS